MDYSMWVPPFGFLRVYVYLQLAVAFRRSSRRLLVPRHPLYALFSLTFIFILRLTFLSTFQRSLIFIGGAKRDRTVDLLLAKQALSQLSYSPIMVGLNGLEPSTSRLSGVRSNQLSYRPLYPTNKRELISQNYIRRVSLFYSLERR